MIKLGKDIIKTFLEKQGYTIRRSTQIELKFSRSYWHQWLSKKMTDFITVYKQNRDFLSDVSSWVDNKSLESSYWRYGVPERWVGDYAGKLNVTGLNDIEMEITCADLIAIISTFLKKKINYLEIGVSVGKNFMQLCNYFRDAEMTGLDVEEIYPIFESFLEEKELIFQSQNSYEIDTLSKKKASKRTSLTSYLCKKKNNKVLYLSADQFRDDTWETISNQCARFNFVFSDGAHSPEALLNEFNYLMQFDLIDREEFVMFWDDMWDESMQNAFYEIALKLCKTFACGEDHIALYSLHGSYGFARKMGIFYCLGDA